MPSVLVELGFLTNRKEGVFLNSKKGQVKMANEIAVAIYSYIKNLKLNTFVDMGNTAASINEINFKVQIAAGKKRLRTKSYNFKGLKNIERKLFGRIYKYYYGNSSSYKVIKEALEKAISKGYKQAFIIAFRNGKKIALEEALKIQ